VVSGRRLVRALELDGWKSGSQVRLLRMGRRSALVVPLHRKLKKRTAIEDGWIEDRDAKIIYVARRG
jgi:antitoxin (DNA-binding transcriptional repressor) of toxin-antitoxin stability system